VCEQASGPSSDREVFLPGAGWLRFAASLPRPSWLAADSQTAHRPPVAASRELCLVCCGAALPAGSCGRTAGPPDAVLTPCGHLPRLTCRGSGLSAPRACRGARMEGAGQNDPAATAAAGLPAEALHVGRPPFEVTIALCGFQRASRDRASIAHAYTCTCVDVSAQRPELHGTPPRRGRGFDVFCTRSVAVLRMIRSAGCDDSAGLGQPTEVVLSVHRPEATVTPLISIDSDSTTCAIWMHLLRRHSLSTS
jgi:hypothetical protein